MPELASPPRPVPWTIQWQLLQYRILLVIGCAFVLVSLLVFIVPQLAAGNRFESAWQIFPFIHLSVGLGLLIGPLVNWRRRVAILKWGELAPATIVALQDQGTTCSTGEESYGVRNVTGPWLDFDTAFAKAQTFWNRTLPSARPGASDFPSSVLMIFGCFAAAMGIFASFFMVAMLTFTWLSNEPVTKKILWTLFCLGFLAAYLVAVWIIRRCAAKMNRFISGELTMENLGVPTIARCRFVFRAPDGRGCTATADIDLRHRLQTAEANPTDLAIYLPHERNRYLLIGGFWPPIAFQDGKWVRPQPTAV